jgi:hypothetical protein
MSVRAIFFAVAALTFFLLTACGLTLFFRAGRLNNWLTLAQIKERVSADLPRGPPLSKIDRYFTDSEVEHSYYEPGNEVSAMIHSIWGGTFLVRRMRG